MSEAEMIFTALAELSTRQIAETYESNRYAGKCHRRKNRRWHCQESAVESGRKSGEKSGEGRKLFAIQGAEKDRTMKKKPIPLMDATEREWEDFLVSMRVHLR